MNERHRSELLAAIETDLIGPHDGLDEQLVPSAGPRSPLPDDVYLTGLLLPQEPDRVESNADIDDDAGAVADRGHESTDDPGASIPTALAARPRVLGLSFSLGPDTTTFCVRFEAGRYEPFWTEGDKRVFIQGDRDPDLVSWVRKQVVVTGRLAVAERGYPGEDLYEISLEDATGTKIDGLRCRARLLRQPTALQVTVTVENSLTQVPGPFGRNCATWFQTQLHVTTSGSFISRPDMRADDDEDGRSNALLYRNVHEWAVGHTCSASWDSDEAPRRVSTDWLPRQLVKSMSADGHERFKDALRRAQHSNDAGTLGGAETPEELVALLSYLPDEYENWLNDRAAEVPNLSAEELRQTAARHIHNAREALGRIRRGLEALADPIAFEAFRLAQRAMHLQTVWKQQQSKKPVSGLSWRPFQLGFQLASLAGLVFPFDKETGQLSQDRAAMDLLWFPTGGGKTEAYLGLCAFLLFLRRLRDQDRSDRGDGVSIIMRYTLRLLTTQQFERAAATILACEVLRRSQPWSKEDDPQFSVGLWVGNSTTPSSTWMARTDQKEKAKMLKACPCCGKQLKWDEGGTGSDPYLVRCGRLKAKKTSSCELNHKAFGPLPVYTIDELVYRRRPSLLLGTVDKFAQIVRTQSIKTGPQQENCWRPHGGSYLFGQEAGHRPPELIIQDELHLISGPLGTITALYEAAIDQICTMDGVPPKVIGSTATIRRAADQVRRLFDREVFQFPPSVLDYDDSCFAVVDDNVPGRFYVGVTTAGRSAKFSLASVQASILQRASEDAVVPQVDRDPWWTVLTYFNSLRELGGALVMVHDDVPAAMRIRSQMAGTQMREPLAATELTSRLPSEEIPEALDRLMREYASIDNPQDIDVVLATNMISVGVDIPRLGVMVVNGQPRSMAEYIQASSRVGRNNVPGLVVTIYNAHRPRDLSRYEAFRTWHAALYREVEATGVTPYAPRAREKALHSAVVALARHLVPGLRDDPPTLSSADAQLLLKLTEAIVLRAQRADQNYPEDHDVQAEIQSFISIWQARSAGLKWYLNDFNPPQALMLSWEEEARRRQVGLAGGGARPTPNSMRDVEPSVWYRLVERLR